MADKQKRTVVVLNGSPRRKGNTAVALGWLEKALEKHGWRVRRHDLYPLDFRGCAHCDHCKRIAAEPGCKLKDELRPVLAEVWRAGALVLASPVYCWSVSGCLGAALDRFYCFFKDGDSLLAGKRVIGVFTAGGDAFDGMDLCVETARRLVDYGQAEYVGTLACPECGTPKETAARAELRAAARALAAAL